MVDFDYWEPDNLWEAISIISNMGEKVLPLAGGTDLLLKIKRKQIDCTGVVNLKRIEELKAVDFDGQTMKIGALNTVSTLLETESVVRHFPVLAKAAQALGTPQIRNLATVGGNLCNASPAADLSVAFLAYDGQVNLAGPEGERTVAVQDFFTGPGKTVLKQGEILASVELRVPSLNSRGAFMKHGLRKSHEIALVNSAVLLFYEPGTEKIQEARIALGAVAPTVLRSSSAEGSLKNAEAGEKAWEEAANEAVNEVNPIDDVRSSAGYRKHMVGVLTKRTLREAWGGSYEENI